MEYFNNLLEKRNMHQFVLTILFIIFLVTGYRMPESIANLVDTPFGKIIIIISALALFAYSNPILGVLGLLVSYELIKRSYQITGLAALEAYYPTEEKKWSPFSPMHQFPYTLEQEMVKKMTNIKFNDDGSPSTFKPVIDDLHDAAPVNYDGVI
jgi:hypothetical protein